jgi:hypothetical protein
MAASLTMAISVPAALGPAYGEAAGGSAAAMRTAS